MKWTSDEEHQRRAMLRIGVEPTLRHYWRGIATARLIESRGELLEFGSEFAGVINDLDVELAYRGAVTA